MRDTPGLRRSWRSPDSAVLRCRGSTEEGQRCQVHPSVPSGLDRTGGCAATAPSPRRRGRSPPRRRHGVRRPSRERRTEARSPDRPRSERARVRAPSMSLAQIQAAVDASPRSRSTTSSAPQRSPCCSSRARTAPRARPLVFQVGYYTEVAGLGQLADDVDHQRLDRRLQPVRPGGGRLQWPWTTSGDRCRT